MRTGRNRAFTLPEVLMTLSITVILGLALMQFMTTTVSGYRAAADMAERVQLESTAANVVVMELSFAGYGDGMFGDLDGPTIEIGLSGREDRSDTFRVHYLEERWLETPVARNVTIDVKQDSKGGWNLYRREDGATRQPAVQDVTNLKLLGLITESGELLSPEAAWPERISAFIVQLSFSWETSRSAYIAFNSPQRIGKL